MADIKDSLASLGKLIDSQIELLRWAADKIRELRTENAVLRARLKFCDLQFVRVNQSVQPYEVPALLRRQAE